MTRYGVLLACALLWRGASASGPGTYAHYTLPQSTSQDFEVDHRWVTIPTADETQGNAIFASMQFWQENGVGGYAGTQVWREGANPQEWRNGTKQLMGTQVRAEEVHVVIFSCWDMDALHQVSWDGDTCERFGGEGEGSHCLITYQFKEGNVYTIRIATTDNRRWTGTVTDTSSGEVSIIGTLIYPDTPGYEGFGLMKTQGAAFQEYFAATGCENQVVSAFGIGGPFFHDRQIQPSAATPDYAAGCNFDDVDACVMPGGSCGAPYVFFMAGGSTQRHVAAGTQLWTTPYTGTEVNCGGHSSDCCENCPQGRGALWCNGDCEWTGSACHPKSSNSTGRFEEPNQTSATLRTTPVPTLVIV